MTTNHHTDSINRNALDAAVDQALTRFAAATQQLTQQQRHLLARLLDVLGVRLAARDGDGAVMVLKAVGHHCGAEAGASVLGYCLAVGFRNAFAGGAR